jgi:hypothetical protein
MYKSFHTRRITGIIFLVLAIYTATDLYWPLTRDIRSFDPREVARLDAQMWHSYYTRKPLKLFWQLRELLQSQYKAPFLRSTLMAYYATRAAFVFKTGRSSSDYQKALPSLEKLYTCIEQMSSQPFSVQEAAKLELAWWIIHRERNKYSAEELETAMARTAAAVYQIPPQYMMPHAHLRAQAMHIRDTHAASHSLTEADWQHIQQLLSQSWQSLWATVNKAG